MDTPRRGTLTIPRWAFVAGLLACAGCTVGPDYRRPEDALPERWAEADSAEGAGAQPAALQPADIARWWTAFDDPVLSELVERALADNLDLAEAEARLRTARAERTSAGAVRWPSVEATAGAARGTADAGANPATLVRAGFDALWELDLFGGTRRNVEAAEADVKASALDLAAVRVSLAAEVAATYLELRGAQQELEIARHNLEAQQETVALTRRRFESGLVGALDVHSAEAQADTTRAAIPALEAGEHASMHALGVLLGAAPEALIGELSEVAPLPAAPPAVPAGVPSELLRRRPDIRAAEARLHAATARIGVATADLFPHLTLAASVGAQSERLTSLAEHAWSLGSSLVQPLFAGGRLRAGVEAQRALTEEQLAAYRQTVLSALQEVETALSAGAREVERRSALADSLHAEEQALELANELYGAGRTGFLDVLSAQRLRFEAEDALAQSERQVDLDLVALYKALGGGWDPEARGMDG